jgi:uncharacterized phiE125 gp8 family phage protein
MSNPNWFLSRGDVDANTEPISLAVAKLHLIVSGNAQNTAIQALCTAARQQCENFTNRALAVSPYTLKFDRFPCGSIVLPVGAANVANVSITHIDANGVSQTVDANTYTVLQRQDSFPEIALDYSETWPVTRCQQDAVTVTFNAGAATVPDALKQGMLLYIGHLFENRTAVVVGTIATEVPMAVDALWAPYRIFWM